MKELKMFINGKFEENVSGKWINVLNPSTEEITCLMPDGTADDARRAIDAAAAAQPAWERTPAVERAAYLVKIAAGIRERADELTQIIVKEGGKTQALARTEVLFTADYLEYMAGWARRYEGEIIPSDRPKETILLFKKPIGVTTGILPWNFPFFLIARKMAPALVTGNTIVIKPSQLTPENAYVFAQISAETGLPAGVFNILNGRAELQGIAVKALGRKLGLCGRFRRGGIQGETGLYAALLFRSFALSAAQRRKNGGNDAFGNEVAHGSGGGEVGYEQDESEERCGLRRGGAACVPPFGSDGSHALLPSFCR